MKSKHIKRRYLSVGLAVLSLAIANHADAKKLSKDPGYYDSLTTVLKLPQGTAGLSLDLENCDFQLRHERLNDIEVRVNYPQHWHVDDAGNIKQTGVAKCGVGAYHTQNGNTIIGQGTVQEDVSINITGDGVEINGQKLPLESRVAKPGQHGVEMATDGIFINGRRLKRCSLDPKNARPLEVLQIVVPENYQGTLKVDWQGDFPARIDRWNGGDLKLFSAGKSALAVADVKSNCSLRTNRLGGIEIEKIDAPQLDIDADGLSKIRIKHLQGEKANISGSYKTQIAIGEMTVQGCTVKGRNESSISLGESSDQPGSGLLKVAHAQFDCADQSVLQAKHADIQACLLTTSGGAKIDLQGSFNHIEDKGSTGGITIDGPSQ